MDEEIKSWMLKEEELPRKVAEVEVGNGFKKLLQSDMTNQIDGLLATWVLHIMQTLVDEENCLLQRLINDIIALQV